MNLLTAMLIAVDAVLKTGLLFLCLSLLPWFTRTRSPSGSRSVWIAAMGVSALYMAQALFVSSSYLPLLPVGPRAQESWSAAAGIPEIHHDARSPSASSEFLELAAGKRQPSSESVGLLTGSDLREGGHGSFAFGLGITIWILVALLLLYRTAGGVWLSGVIRSRSIPAPDDLADSFRQECRRMGIRGEVDLLLTLDLITPVTGGLFRPFVALPSCARSWPEAHVRSVFTHELTHVRRFDAPVNLIAHAACALLWFNPFLWLMRWRLGFAQELSCDQAVLRSGTPPPTYARFLVGLAERMKSAPSIHVPSILGGCFLDIRVRRILQYHPRNNAREGVITMCSLLLAILLPLALAGGAPPLLPAANPWISQDGPGPETPEQLERFLDGLIQREMERDGIPGAAFVFVKDGKEFFKKGYGYAVAEKNVPVSPDKTIFRIGSTTKVFTALALLQLADRGDIDLDTDVNAYLKGLRLEPTFPNPVTTRHILTHTSGFDQLMRDRLAPDEASISPLSEFLAENLVRIRPPGTVSCYDTYAITLGGEIIERVSGLSYEGFLRKNVWRPLGMGRTNISVPDSLQADVAQGYAVLPSGLKPQRWEYFHTFPASSINSTASDMAKFMIALLEGGQLETTRILETETATAMMTQQYSNHPELDGYGFGLFAEKRNGHRVASHGGNMDGYSTQMFLLPDLRMGFYLAYNREHWRLRDVVTEQLMDRFFPARRGSQQLRPRYKGEVDINNFTGTYVNNLRCHTCTDEDGYFFDAEPFEVRAGAGGDLIIGGGPSIPVGPLLFQRDDGLLIGFRKSETGMSTHMFIRQSVFERLSEDQIKASQQRAERRRLAAESMKGKNVSWICPPCPVDCHDTVYEKPGRCPVCRMELIASPKKK